MGGIGTFCPPLILAIIRRLDKTYPRCRFTTRKVISRPPSFFCADQANILFGAYSISRRPRPPRPRIPHDPRPSEPCSIRYLAITNHAILFRSSSALPCHLQRPSFRPWFGCARSLPFPQNPSSHRCACYKNPGTIQGAGFGRGTNQGHGGKATGAS